MPNTKMVNHQSFWKIFRQLLNIFFKLFAICGVKNESEFFYATSTFELQMCFGPIFTSNLQHKDFGGYILAYFHNFL
jgi:hypothetical protein